MKTTMVKKGERTPAWHLVDLEDKVLGRAATRIATVLMGKHTPEYTPHVDTGDFVVAVNAAKVKLTGASKMTQRTYQRYSHHPGGLKEETLAQMLEKNPVKVVRDAVRRMLPKTRLGRDMLRKFKVYAGPDHKQQAQQPQPLELA
jgi:large subunit ribosomal protein L13